MQPRKFALFGGIVMLALGLLAFIPQFSPISQFSLLPLDTNTAYGAFLGFIPMNVFNKMALILFGAVGILVSGFEYTSLPRSIQFSKAVFWVMGIAAILGLIPATQTLFGFWPLYGADVAVHALFAALGAYYGFAIPIKAHQNPIVKNAGPPKFV